MSRCSGSLCIKSICVGAALAMSGLVSPPASGETKDLDAVVAEIRAASERFTDVDVALKEGYIRDPHGSCITAEMEGQPAEKGAMGIHYFRPDMLGITATEPRVDGSGTHTDLLNPSVVLYEPQADGSLELVGDRRQLLDNADVQTAYFGVADGDADEAGNG